MRTATTRMVFVFCLALFALTTFAYGATPPVLTLSQDANHTVTIDSTGTPTLSCIPVTDCSTTNSNVVAGKVTWQGKIGVFNLTASGATKPVLTAPQIDISLSGVRTSAFGAGSKTLTVKWTDVGFDGVGNATMNETTTISSFGSASALYTSFVDITNAPFGTGTTVGTLSATTVGNSTQMLSGPGPTSEPYSMTNVVAVTMTQSTFGYAVDFSLTAPPPPPLTLACASNAGSLNNFYSSMLVANGGVPPYTFSTSPLPVGLTLDTTTGAITGTPTTPGDFTYSAQVIDTLGHTANTPTDCPLDISPPPLHLICPATTGVVGNSFDAFLQTTGGVSPYTYALINGTQLPNGLALNPSTGEISGTPTAPGNGSFDVQVTDTSGDTDTNTTTGTCNVTTNPPPSAMCVVINAVQGVPLSTPPLSGSGGTGGPYTFSSNDLPNGLTMAADGSISGTPTDTGTFAYHVTVTDKDGNTGTIECSLTINPPPSATCAVINAVQGVPLSTLPLNGSGGTGGPYTFTSNDLPAGLTMAADGSISGTPTASGTFTYHVTVTDKDGHTGTIQCSVTVNPPPSANCVSIVAVQGVAITPVTLTGSGGVGGPYTFTSNDLPAGLSISTSGTISGTPTASGTFTYHVTVKDSAGNTGTITCSVTVNPPPSANCVSIVAVQGVAITPVTLTGSGGVGGPYTFSSNDLPAGLSISTSGTISGTPTASGTFTYHVTVADAAGNTGTISCSVTINPPPSANCVSIVAVQGVAITPVTLTGSGGVGGPYTFSSSDLPAGLSISTSGTISGTPTASGTFTYHVTVADAAGNTGTITCSVTINPPPSANCVSIVAVQGVAITPVTLTGSGGVGGPYTFSSNDLPAGLSISASGTISGTPTASGTFTYHVTVADAAGNTGTITCSVTINPPPSANCVTIVAVQGVAITPVTLTGSGGVGGPYTFSSSDLPAGLSISTSGTISGTPTASGTFTYHVTVKDAAGNTGTISCSVTVNPPPSANCVSIVAVQGVAITPVTLTGSGGVGGPYTFTSNDLPAGLSISLGGTISGTPTVSGTFTYHVTVKDAAGNTGTITCSVTINPPPSANCVAITGAVQGVAITPVTLSGSGGVGGPYTFSSSDLPAGLSISSTGTISGTPTVSGTFTYHVTVKDAAGNSSTISCSVMINPPAPPPLIVACPTAATGTVGTPYSGQVPVSGGTPPYTFSVYSGSLPAGLTLNTSTGAITGTPTTAGSFAFTIKVVDTLGMVAYSQCTSNCTTINATWDLSGPNQTLGTSQAYTVNGITVTAYGFTNGGAPTNLYWKQAGGDENGLGIANTSSDHEIDTNTFIQLDFSDLIAKGATSAAMTIGSVQSGEGFNIYGSNTLGQIGTLLKSGTSTLDFTPFAIPQFGTYKYVSVRASAADVLLDAISAVLTPGCTITITGLPSASCVSITAVQGVAITPVTLTGSGGAGGPYTFSSSDLPAGLTISTSGTISGTPTVSGTFTYHVTVKDAAGNTGTFSCSVTINPPPSASCVAITNAVQGVAITPVTLTGSGGVGGPYTFSSTDLPAGLSISTSGTISGTPSVSGSFTYHITVKDKAGNSGTISCSVTVIPQAPPPLIVSCPTQGTATVGTPYSSQVPVSGGTPPYTYALNTGSLPPGLTLNSDGSITGTPTSAGSFTFSIKVTDKLGMTAISQCSSSCTAITDDYTFIQYLGTLGTSQAYTVNGLTITAYGYYWDGANPTNAGTTTNLYGKQAGGDENGLGISNTSSDHEITNKTFVQLDLQNVLNAGATGAQMSVGSVQVGESYAIYGSNKQGVLGTLLTTTPLTADDTVFPVPSFGTYRYVALTAVAHDVLLEDFSVSFPQGCTVVVSPAPLIISCPANTGKVGVPYSSAITVSGGTAPYTFTIISGSLPPGLTLNSSTGAITGTPTGSGGTYTFTTSVTDSTGGNAQTVTKKCTITISAPPTPPVVSCPPNKGGTVGTSFTTTIPVTGGTAPFTFSISSGSLPPGLTLNTTTGVISGKPTTAGSYSFTIMVVDAAGNVVYSSCDTGCSSISEKFDFLAACGKFGSSKVYKTNGIALTAYGYDNYGHQKYLNGRGNGNADDGLGISGNLDDGIDSNSYVQFDLTNAISAGASDVQISVGSIHSGETYNVYGSNTLGQPGTLLLANCKADGGTIHVPSFPNHKYICIRANNKCVHVKNITCTNPCKCTITISKKGCTYSKGEYGGSGNDGYNKAHDGWGTTYGSKGSCVKIGGSKSYTFTSPDTVATFLNKSGNAGPASYSSTNSTSGNDYATQVLALQMNVDLSNSGVIAPGLANLKIQSGLLKGWTVQQVLDVSNQVLGGDMQLPYWMSWSDATSILSSVNAALDSGSYDSGYLDIN